MVERNLKNNQAVIYGEVISNCTYHHEVFGEKFYKLEVAVRRNSGIMDIVPLFIKGKDIDADKSYAGKQIHATGDVRSYNRKDKESGKSKLIVAVYVKQYELVDSIPDNCDTNTVILSGYLCKEPIYRSTPLGRDITDLLIAVNRPHGKSDYIPAICWDRRAEYAAGLHIGDKVRVYARFQSREYEKRISETEAEKCTAYEMSISEIKLE